MFLAGGEIALSVFLELFAKLASYDQVLNFVTEKQVLQQLKEWQKILPSIQAVLTDAEEKQMKDPNIKSWLTRLQLLGYDVDDISNEFAIEVSRRKSNQHQASTSKVPKSIPTWLTRFVDSRAFMFNKTMISKLEEITAKLNGLAGEKGSLGLRENIAESEIFKRNMKPSLQSMSFGDESHLYGRDKEKAEILELLLSNNGNKDEAFVIHIFGVGGIGKTTLAQHVYYDNSIQKSFHYKTWISVSKDFDVTSVTSTILRSITEESLIVPDQNHRQASLENKWFCKRFLLILDNVWEENYDDLAILLKPFGVGTKVIVTTRSCSKVSPVGSTAKAYQLQQLSEKDCLSVFTQHALKASDFSGHPKLQEVGENIVKRCNGLPLAAKAIGGLLCNRVDYGLWKDISESEIWDLPEERFGAIPALLLSYQYLPPYLKPCFAYCSLLPKGYEFEQEEIILLWKVEGFLRQTNSKTQIEALAGQYFQDLVSRSFFQTSSRDKSRFVMHDLINDLAQVVAKEICFKLEGNKQLKISEGTRHSSYIRGLFDGGHSFYIRGLYDGVKKFEAFNHMKSLRTFLPFMLPTNEVCFITNTVLVDLLPKLRCLRVFSLKGYHITQLRDIFENLVHICYLDFSYTAIKSLPDSICTLCNLETLLLKECLLEFLPSKIVLLVNLNHLDITGTKIKRMPFGIGRLTNLQRLSDFVLGASDGYQIQDMKDLSHLRGDLSLSGLENITRAQDACQAQLIDKSGLDGLRLKWSTDFFKNRRNEAVEDVLNMLEPHKDLKKLFIENYGGARFPNWIAESSLQNLFSLELNNCRNCKSLPPLGKLPLLKDLTVKGMHNLENVGIEFYGDNNLNAFASLEKLWFQDMPKWKQWDFDDQVAKFPRLLELRILDCPQLLGRLPNSLNSLKKLVICTCKQLQSFPHSLPSLERLIIHFSTQLVVSVSNFPLLYDLEINECAEMVFKDDADFPSLRTVSLTSISKFCPLTERLVIRLKNLQYLRINRCNELMSLSKKQLGAVGHLRSLRDLELISLELEELEEEQLQLVKGCNIESLTIRNCKRLRRLPQELHFLTFLTEMLIGECSCIVSFSTNYLPPALKKLVIQSCKYLRYLVDQEENTSTSNTCLLEHLDIVACPLLKSLSLPVGLQILRISSCSNLASISSSGKLPLGLKQLLISDCSELESMVQTIQEDSCLEHLGIWGCRKLKSLPQGLDKLNHVQKIELCQCDSLISLTESGFPTNLAVLQINGCQTLGALPNVQNLTALKDLALYGCASNMSFAEGGFPTNLTSLSIADPKLCSSLLKWGLHKLTSLKKLFISGEECPDAVIFPQEGSMLPSSLTGITLEKFENLRNLSTKGFQNLTSLQELWILECPNLESLPDKDALLSLGKLYMRNISVVLEAHYIFNQGPEWLKISHIPEVIVNQQSIIPKPSWTIQP